MNKIKLTNSKKADALAMNTIVIAIIALIVLVVVVMIFSGVFSKSGKDIAKTEGEFQKCEAVGTLRKCRMQSDCESNGGFVISKPEGGWSDCKLSPECCSQ